MAHQAPAGLDPVMRPRDLPSQAVESLDPDVIRFEGEHPGGLAGRHPARWGDHLHHEASARRHAPVRGAPHDPSGPPQALLIGRVAAVRRRRRRSLAVAAVVLAAAAAAGWAPHLLHPATQPHRAAASWWASAEGFDAATGARAAVRYSAQPWGTEVEASVSGIRPGTACQIWATTATGQHAAGGGWTVTRGDPHA
jgi:hypothetical protein